MGGHRQRLDRRGGNWGQDVHRGTGSWLHRGDSSSWQPAPPPPGDGRGGAACELSACVSLGSGRVCGTARWGDSANSSIRLVRLRRSGCPTPGWRSRASLQIQLANGSARQPRPRRSPTLDRHVGLGVFRGLRACAIQDAFDSKAEQENTPALYTCRCLLRGRSASARPKNIYRGFLAGLLFCLSLTLLTILDIRRGFLFTDYATRSPFYVLHGLHVPLLGVGVLGIVICLTRLRTLERRIPATGLDRWLPYVIAAVLLADLIAYRAVPAARSLAAGGINVAWLDAFGTIGPWRSVALATSYLLTVWHATMLGILIAGLATIAMPQAFRLYLTRHGVTGSVAGALCAVPQPFCSCCASTMAPSFVRQGASTHFVLAFVVGAPMLNVTTIILAGAMLPTEFAVIRIGAGVVVTVLVSYWVARLTTGTGVATTSSPTRWLAWLHEPEASTRGSSRTLSAAALNVRGRHRPRCLRRGCGRAVVSRLS